MNIERGYSNTALTYQDKKKKKNKKAISHFGLSPLNILLKKILVYVFMLWYVTYHFEISLKYRPEAWGMEAAFTSLQDV